MPGVASKVGSNHSSTKNDLFGVLEIFFKRTSVWIFKIFLCREVGQSAKTALDYINSTEI